MAIDALPQVQPSQIPRSPGQPSKPADTTGNTLPPENRGVDVDISEGGRSALERERQNIADARDSQEFVDFQGEDGAIRLGLWALGKATMDDWSAKGLALTEGSVRAAGEAFQTAFRRNLEENGASTAGSSIALNRHQIVINSQEVPDWFVEEYEKTLSSMGDSKLTDAFENGDTFYVSQPS